MDNIISNLKQYAVIVVTEEVKGKPLEGDIYVGEGWWGSSLVRHVRLFNIKHFLQREILTKHFLHGMNKPCTIKSNICTFPEQKKNTSELSK